MDIAAMSTILSQVRIKEQASISVMKMAMNTSKTQMNHMVEIMQVNARMMELSVNPNLGATIDVRV
ncbi:MAG TPA: putative motility protein [Clostridiales bacterium]|nr:putative motility protein [Clostridiales bacterium]